MADMQMKPTELHYEAKLKALEAGKLGNPVPWASTPLPSCLVAARILCADEVRKLLSMIPPSDLRRAHAGMFTFRWI
jgi:hypothetical protein